LFECSAEQLQLAVFSLCRVLVGCGGLFRCFSHEDLFWVYSLSSDDLLDHLDLAYAGFWSYGKAACGICLSELLNAEALNVVVSVDCVPHHVVDIVRLDSKGLPRPAFWYMLRTIMTKALGPIRLCSACDVSEQWRGCLQLFGLTLRFSSGLLPRPFVVVESACSYGLGYATTYLWTATVLVSRDRLGCPTILA